MRIVALLKNNLASVMIYACLSIVAILVRFLFKDFISHDWTFFLLKWTNIYAEKGFSSLSAQIGDYTPLYNYFLAIISNIDGFLPLHRLYCIKALSCIFDFVIAIYSVKIFKILKPKSNILWQYLIYAIVLFSPIIIMNSSLWGQCDSIYSAFLLVSLFYLMKFNDDKYAHIKSIIAFSIAFCLKLQSIFFFPMIFYKFLNNKKSLINFLIIPFIYFLSCLPAIIWGRKFINCCLIYFQQAQFYNNALAFNYPNIYTLFKFISANDKLVINLILFILFLLVVIFLFVSHHKKIQLNNKQLLLFSFFLYEFWVYFLPYMHERYCFLGEILAILYVFIKPSRFLISFALLFVTFETYSFYLFRYARPDILLLLSLLRLCCILVILSDFVTSLKKTTGKQNINLSKI